MKILLASLSIEKESRFRHNQDCAYPLGLAYLHAVLEKDGHDVRTLFLNNFSHSVAAEKTLELIKQLQPDIVGFQVFSMNRIATFKVLDIVREKYPSIHVVLGGVHISVMYNQIIEKYPHAIAVIGEGELTFRELVEAISSGGSYDHIAGLAFWRDGKLVRTKERALLDNLDVLPFAKHEIFFDEEPKRQTAHIITSRGCPFNCTFCCLKNMTRRKWRTRDVSKVVEEISMLKEKYPRLRYVQLHDDTFTLDNKRAVKFCKLLIDANLSLEITCSTRVKPVSTEMLYWMQKAGFIKIMFGLETGSEALLKSIHKNINKKDVIELFNKLRGFGFDITTFLMCGFPGETESTVAETIQLVRETQKIHYNYIAGIGKLWVYPGTEVYNIMKRAGCIDDEFWLTDRLVPYFTVENPLSKLIEFEERMMNELSLDRMLTFEGFRCQVPHLWREIIIYLLKHPNRFRVLGSALKGKLKSLLSSSTSN